mmetsp:Transcript_75988/g.180775  ORF Transcript_75988/g.180775 Transcript_75988/m.180775 type:complete len:232 (-) Transcript_75988:2090-2785(-)
MLLLVPSACIPHGEALLDLQRCHFHYLISMSNLTWQVPKGLGELMDQLLGLELAIFLLTITIMPHNGRVLHLDHRVGCAFLVQVHDWLHLLHPLDQVDGFWSDERCPLGGRLVTMNRTSLFIPTLGDQSEVLVALKVFGKEVLAATTDDRNRKVLAGIQSRKEGMHGLRRYGILWPLFEFSQRAVVVQEKCLKPCTRLEKCFGIGVGQMVHRYGRCCLRHFRVEHLLKLPE